MTISYGDTIAALDEQGQRLVRALTDVPGDASTQIDGWNTSVLIGHLVTGLAAIAGAAEHQEPGTPAMDLTAWATVTPTAAAQMHQRALASPSDAPALASTLARLVEALSAADPTLPVLLGGNPTLSLFDGVRTRAIELAVHGLDFVPPVAPADACAAVAADALLEALAGRHPGAAVAVELDGATAGSYGEGEPGAVRTDAVTWLKLATGRLGWPDPAVTATGTGEAHGAVLPIVS